MMAVGARAKINRFQDLSMDDDEFSFLDDPAAYGMPPGQQQQPNQQQQQQQQLQQFQQQQQQQQLAASASAAAPSQSQPRPAMFDSYDDWGPLIPAKDNGSYNGGGYQTNTWPNYMPPTQQRRPTGSSPFVNPYGNPAGSNGGYQSFPNRQRNGNRGLYNNNQWTQSRQAPYDDQEYDDMFVMEEQAEQLSDEKRMINGKELLCNRNIPVSEVFLLGPNKEKLGPTPIEKALDMAIAQRVDVVLVNPDQKPPIARLIKWDRYKFELEQESKAKKAGASVTETKEVRLRPTTDSGDVAVKVKAVGKFLSKGNRVKISMRFEGRELQFKEQGKETLLKFIEGLGESARVDGSLSFKTGTYTVMLVPTGKMMPAAA